jgi:ABC-type sulfate transport system substrate-binding protein
MLINTLRRLSVVFAISFFGSAAAETTRLDVPYDAARETVLKNYEKQFRPIKVFSVEKIFGAWDSAQKAQFDDGGVFDQMVVNR